MSTPTLIRIAGILGGLSWLAQAVFTPYDAAAPVVNALYWGGGALIVVALVGLGAGLVSGASWLRLIVGVCLPLLVWSILELMHSSFDDRVVDGGFGGLMVLVCSFGLTGRTVDDTHRAGGSHSK